MPNFTESVKQAERLLKRGASDKQVKPGDYDRSVKDLADPDEVIRTILARLRVASAFREPFEREWRRAFMAWMQRLDSVMEDSWESKRYVPMVLKHIETAIPAVTATVFNGPNLWSLRGKTPQGRDSADALDDLIHWQAEGPSRLGAAFDQATFFAVLYGTAFMDCSWSEKEAVQQRPVVVHDVDEETGLPLFEEDGTTPVAVKVLREEKVTVEDWPVFRAMPPMEVWPAPYSQVGDDAEWIIYSLDTSLNKMKESAGDGHLDLEAIEVFEEDYYPKQGGFSQNTADQSLFESANPNLWNEWLSDLGLEERDDQDSEDQLDGDKTIKLLVYRSKTEMITLAPDKHIVGYSVNPYIHGKTGIINHQYIPIPQSPFGRGLGTILLSHQELANENINLFMDVSKISLMAPVVINRSNVSSLDRNFVWEPNTMIHSRDVNNAAKRLDVPAPTNLAMLFDQSLNRDADEISGFSEQARGLSPSGVNTATEFSGLQANIATRSFMHVRRLRDFMALIGKMMVSLNQQFMTKEQIVTIVGENGLDYRRVEPWEIVGEVEVISTAATTNANPALRASQMLQATQIVMPVLQNPQALTPMVARWIRTLLETIEIEDVDRMIPKNVGKMRDAATENIALKMGVKLEPSEFDNHAEHMQAHSVAAQEAEAEGIDASEIMAHIQKHTELAQTQGEAEAQQAGGAQAGGPERQTATALGNAQGSGGIPGAAAPGPAAAPGRPA